MTDTPVLAVCADIANGHKHLVCDCRRTGKEDFRSQSKPDVSYSIVVEHQGDCTDQDLLVELREMGGGTGNTADDANRVLNRWLELGLEPKSLFIQIWVDVGHETADVVYDWGQTELLSHVCELWEDFVRVNSVASVR